MIERTENSTYTWGREVYSPASIVITRSSEYNGGGSCFKFIGFWKALPLCTCRIKVTRMKKMR